MVNEAREYFDQLLLVARSGNSLLNAYKVVWELFNRILRQEVKEEGLQMTDAAARISYLASLKGLSQREIASLHTLRSVSRRVLNRMEEPSREGFLRDLETLAHLIHRLSGLALPAELSSLFSGKKGSISPDTTCKPGFIKQIRVCFRKADENFLYVLPAVGDTAGWVKVRYTVPPLGEAFAETIPLLWSHAQLNLLDVVVDQEGVFTPGFIVLEPDYLIDISSLAECFKEYGNHPFNYILGRLVPVSNARPILTGNIANLFLDEWIHAEKEISYLECMKKAFRRYPVEIAACEELKDPVKEREFFSDCKLHFSHIRRTVERTFNDPRYGLDRSDAVLEPSYICEALGIQGRLDYMQRDMSAFIEMKSGKADEYAIRGKQVPKENNTIQMLLYQAVLEYAMGKQRDQIHPYLLYTRYPLLYPARSSWLEVRKAINLRNLIVHQEYTVQYHNDIEFTAALFRTMRADKLNLKQKRGRYWEEYLKPDIDHYFQRLRELSPLEQNYFYALYNFLVKEQYTVRSGNTDHEGRAGSSSLWLSTLTEKCEAGEIFYDLILKETTADRLSAPCVVFGVPELEENGLKNFRVGDTVIFYERNKEEDNATNKMVFKGNIERMGTTELVVRLRFAQRNKAVFPPGSTYALEHDHMDGTFRSMYNGLTVFLHAQQSRRDLLLMQRLPEVKKITHASEPENDFERISRRALAAKDLFLLLGPPGTGKTSRALKQMVVDLCSDPDTHLLLMAYTNRAVDEICKMLKKIRPSIDFIRIGNEMACEEEYREYLLENNLSGCDNREKVRDRIVGCRVIVGTVASVSGKPELFHLKRFDVAIVDEASQVLETQLLNIWCATGREGKNAVGKFILIGDHKQLPAVVSQSTASSEVKDELLCSAGFQDLRHSLFERLYRFLDHTPNREEYIDQLERQGRMHPEIAAFPGEAFYAGRLKSVGLPHQLEEGIVPLEFFWEGEMIKIDKRVCFLPCRADRENNTGKVNQNEAHLSAMIVEQIARQYGEAFDPSGTVGLIVPYRSQIALIRRKIMELGIPGHKYILIDTVERFQGSERDHIIYSTCVNYGYQMNFLSSTVMEGGQEVDRKLNVAITRARKQLIILGVYDVLRTSRLYEKLIHFAGYSVVKRNLEPF